MTSEAEEWRAVVGYEGLYEVSSHGRVRSLNRTVFLPRLGQTRTYTGQILRSYPHLADYPQVKLSKNGKIGNFFIHFLVCEAWHGRRVGDLQVAHWDNNRTNNRPGNLRWATRSENAEDKVRHGTAIRGERARNAKLTAAEVLAIRDAAVGGARQVDLASAYGVAEGTISNIVKRNNWAWLD